MQQLAFKEYALLSTEEHQELHQSNSGDSFKRASFLKHDYEWLLSPYESNEWKILVKGTTRTLKWDSVLPAPLEWSIETSSEGEEIKRPVIGDARKLSDNPFLIEDMKMAFVISKLTRPKSGLSLNNADGCRQFCNKLKRYAIDAVMRPMVINPSQLTKFEFEKSLDQAANKSTITQAYYEILKEYFRVTPIAEIPVKKYLGNKNPPHMFVGEIFENLGLRTQQIKQDDNVKALLAENELRVREYHDEFSRFEVVYAEALEAESYKVKVNEKEYSNYLKTLKSVRHVYRVFPNLFHYELVPYDFDAVSLKEKQDFSEQAALAGRTRDIPPKVFLKMMDAAARYVLDYAEELFDAEAELKEYSDQCLARGIGKDYVGKLTNRAARRYKQIDGRKHSPFPLGAYKHVQEQPDAKTYPTEVYELIQKDINAGRKPSEVKRRFMLTKNQYDYIKSKMKLPEIKGISLLQALYRFVPFSCAVIIFALSARREKEVFGLKAGCIESDDLGELWINSYVAKTLQDDYKFTAVSLVDKAVKILERLSLSARERMGDDRLFVFDTPINRPPKNLTDIRGISIPFFKYIGLEADENGGYWKLSEHQFRRFFAIMYFYRYDATDVDALMHEFAHCDWGMTQIYLTQTEPGKAQYDIYAENESVKNERIYDYVVREDVGGEMLPRLQSELSKTVSSIVDNPKNRKRYIARIKEQGYVIDFVNTGLCFGGTPALSKICNCYRDGHVMTHDASKEMCDGCPAQLTVPEIAKGEARKLSDSGNSTILSNLLGACNECEDA